MIAHCLRGQSVEAGGKFVIPSPVPDLLQAYAWGEFERVIVLSPHLDDAALSCGGLLARLRGEVPRVVVTVCAGDPPDPAAIRGTWRESFGTPAERRREDRAAMKALACEHVHLGFCDAIYRQDSRGRPLYQRVMATAMHSDDELLIEEIVAVLSRICTGAGPALVISPMGIGEHIDHIICARAAAALSGVQLLYYEDMPYSAPGWDRSDGDSAAAKEAERALVALGRLPEQSLSVTFDLDSKAEIVARYRTQLPVLFESDVQKLRRALAAKRDPQRQSRSDSAGEQPVEVYWIASDGVTTLTSAPKP